MNDMPEIYSDDWLKASQIKLSGGEKLFFWTDQPKTTSTHVALFLHGMKGYHSGLSSLAWEYRRYFPDATIVIPDLPGYGISEPFKNLQKNDLLKLYTDAVEQLISHIGARRYVMVGHSFGAMIAYNYLAESQDKRVTDGYMYAPHVDGRGMNGRLLNLYGRSASLLPPKIRSAYLYNRPVNHFESMIFTKTSNSEIRKRIYKSRRDELGFKEPQTLLASFKLSAAVNLLKSPIPANTRLIFIHGTMDNISPLGPLKRLAELNSAPIVVVDKVGHYLVNEDAVRSGTVFSPAANYPKEYAIIKLT